jgi:hypothetical protein
MSRRMNRVWGRVRCVGEQGTTTAEYAIVIMAAVAFAGVLLGIMHSSVVSSALTGVVKSALTFKS